MAGNNARGGPVIRVNVDAPPVNLEPPLLTDSISAWVLHHVADRLVEENLPGQLQGNLASRWEISEDRKTYCFTIAKDRKFSDGQSVTASAVEESLEMAVAHREKSRVGFYLSNIKNITTKGADEVCIQLQRPSPNFLQILADASFSIYRKSKTAGEFIYSGKYVVEARSPNSIDLRRLADGQIFKIESLSSKDAAEKFRNKELEVFRNSGTGGLKEIKTFEMKKAVMPDERTYFIAFNLNSQIFRDRKNRAALVSMIKWDAITAGLNSIGLTRSYSLLSPSLMSDVGIRLEPEKLTGPPVKLPKFSVLTQSGFELDELVKSGFSGLKIEHKNLAKPEFLKALYSGEFDVLFTGYGITVRDWDYLSTLFHSKSSHNMVFLKSHEIDGLLEQARSSDSSLERQKLYRRVLAENNGNLWYVPVTHTPLIFVLRPELDSSITGASKIVTTPWFRFDELNWKK